MTDSSISAFNQRVKKYSKKKPGKQIYVPGQGMVYKKTGSGLRFPRFPVILVLAMIFGMKAMIVLEVGEYEYNKRLGQYYDPSMGEKIGLYVMKADPFTMTLYDLAAPVFAR
ncbi:MAG: hypothetical protein GXP03_12330 [Alphaproteobacteria bacterium]|nr:hypothetical protein [Alphaproteobacteria bacterium]